MTTREKIEELLEASKDGTISTSQVTEAGLHRGILQVDLLFQTSDMLLRSSPDTAWYSDIPGIQDKPGIFHAVRI